MNTDPDQGRPRAPRWMRITLGVSLALNLAVIGLAGGAALRFRDHERAMPRTMIGAMLHELPHEDRRALHDHARERGEFSERKKARRAEAEAMEAALRAVPFDPAAVEAVMTGHAEQRRAGQEAAMRDWLDRVAAMSDADRAAYADRLHKVFEHGWKKKHRDDD